MFLNRRRASCTLELCAAKGPCDCWSLASPHPISAWSVWTAVFSPATSGVTGARTVASELKVTTPARSSALAWSRWNCMVESSEPMAVFRAASLLIVRGSMLCWRR